MHVSQATSTSSTESTSRRTRSTSSGTASARARSPRRLRSPTTPCGSGATSWAPSSATTSGHLEPTASLQLTPAGHGGLRSAVAVTAAGKTAWFGTGDQPGGGAGRSGRGRRGWTGDAPDRPHQRRGARRRDALGVDDRSTCTSSIRRRRTRPSCGTSRRPARTCRIGVSDIGALEHVDRASRRHPGSCSSTRRPWPSRSALSSTTRNLATRTSTSASTRERGGAARTAR